MVIVNLGCLGLGVQLYLFFEISLPSVLVSPREKTPTFLSSFQRSGGQAVELAQLKKIVDYGME